MRIKNYIGGRFVDAQSGEYFDNINPATGQVFGSIPNSEEGDVEQAYQVAKQAFPIWSSKTVEERSEILLKIADGIDHRAEELAIEESKDNGKPVSLARRVDIPRASSNFRFFAKAISQFGSESYHGQAGLNYTLRQPIGVVGCISPWNLPLYLFTWKIAPALAAGNTVVAKPSEVTPVTSNLLAEICENAGLPAGVLNIVNGLGQKAGVSIVKHPGIKAISFTGGTKTGAHIASVAAPMFKKLSLEMGGKNPNLIFADCDYERMLRTTMHSSFANQGQICLCGSRILVEERLYDRFVSDFVERVKALKVGAPNDPKTKIGAVVSEAHMDKILGYINLAKEEGGKILTGGNRVFLSGLEKDGYYIAPTVIIGLNQQCRTNQEEIFGPVVTIESFKDDQEALLKANATQYGLSSTIWTENISRAHRIAHDIEAGIVWVNCWLERDLRTPFGGVKASGVGREGGFEALRFFTEPKNVCIGNI